MQKHLLSVVVLLMVIFNANSQASEKKGVIILGSYHAYYMDWANVKGFKRNSSVPDFTSQQLGWTLSHNVIADNPEFCILQTGPEDLLLGISPDRVVINISKIYNELSQDSIKLIILSGVQNPQKKSIGSVNRLNEEVQSWAMENEILYIDVSDFLNSSNAFDEDFKILAEYQEKIIRRINFRLNELKNK